MTITLFSLFNPIAISTSIDLYNDVYSAVKKCNKMYMSEVTIGASLPIRTTLSDLLVSGDAIKSIVGIMSVSAGVVLTEICDNGLKFSEALSKTYMTGLFEDDVFADLEGTEAAQKLLILARTLGKPMSLDDIDIEPLARRRYIESWNNLTSEFQEENAKFRELAERAKSNGNTLRFVQRIECDPPAELGLETNNFNIKASVRLEEVPLDSSYAMVKGAVYYFAFHTARYSQNPLIVQVCEELSNFCLLFNSNNALISRIGSTIRCCKYCIWYNW